MFVVKVLLLIGSIWVVVRVDVILVGFSFGVFGFICVIIDVVVFMVFIKFWVVFWNGNVLIGLGALFIFIIVIVAFVVLVIIILFVCVYRFACVIVFGGWITYVHVMGTGFGGDTFCCIGVVRLICCGVCFIGVGCWKHG